MLDGETVRLTRKEHRVLALLVQHAGEIITRAIFLTQIWHHVPETRPGTVDRHINALRRRLGTYGDQYIETVIGVGYRFRPSPEH